MAAGAAAVVAGAVAALFVPVYFGTQTLVRRLPIPASLLPWIGGSLVGVLVLLSKGRLVGQGTDLGRLAGEQRG